MIPRPNVLSVGKGHVASQNKSGSITMMELLRTMIQEIEEMNKCFDDWNNYPVKWTTTSIEWTTQSKTRRKTRRTISVPLN